MLEKEQKDNIVIYNTNKEDPEDEFEHLDEELSKIFKRFMPYQKNIMIYGLIILIMLVVLLGVAYGGMKVCSDLDGILDSKFKCHPNYYQLSGFDRVGQTFIIPFNITPENDK